VSVKVSWEQILVFFACLDNFCASKLVRRGAYTYRPPTISLVWRFGRGQIAPKLSLSTVHEPAILWTVITAGIIKMSPRYTGSFTTMILELLFIG